jgi:hypothetical protein
MDLTEAPAVPAQENVETNYSAERAARHALDQRTATAMGENTEWLRAHENEILQEHPEWRDKHVAVATLTKSKIVAVAADFGDAIDEGLKSPELLEAAQREGLLLLGTSWIFTEY